MLLIDNETKTIAFNRADEVNFILEVNNEDGTPFDLLRTDYVRLNIMKKKDYISGVMFTKVFPCDMESNAVQIELTKEEMEMFEKTNKPVTYWYDFVLNDKTTLLGYESSMSDTSGAKKFIVLPRGDEDDA